MYRVRRTCAAGECPCSDGDCDCSDPVVDVDVDELSSVEIDYFLAHGTDDQRRLIRAWLAGDEEAERLAGQRDIPGLLNAPCGACGRGLDCISHSALHHEGW